MMLKKVFIFFFLVIAIIMGGWYLSRPKISVVMSTYNREALLPKAIESILKQTFDEFELIIINDGALDKTAEILDDYARKDKRIRIFTNKENKGLVASLNIGIDKARGKYIARMDDDDISLPTRFEKQYDFMEKNQDIAVVSSFVANTDNNLVWGFHKETDPEKIKMLLYLNIVPISHPASFIRKSFLKKNNIRYNPDYKAAEDRKFWLDILDAGGKISAVPEVLLLYRLHHSNPQDYYNSQSDSAYKFFHNEILKRFGYDETIQKQRECDLYKEIFNRNQKLNLFSQDLLAEYITKKCPPENSERVKHPNWSDYFVFDANRVCRFNINDCATIKKKTDKLLILKWDNWDEEIFEKENETWELKK